MGAADGSLFLSNISTPDLTVDEGNDILQKLSDAFLHQMEHIPTGVALAMGYQ